METAKVLVIDDEKNILEAVKMVLIHEGYGVELASSGLDGIDLFRRGHHEIVLLDVRMPGQDGLQVLRVIKDLSPLTEVIMISGHSGIEEALTAARLGAFDFLEKPISRDRLLLAVRNAAEKVGLRKENQSLRLGSERKYELVGRSQVMENLRTTIERVARSDSTVLILGESGTGKELIARQVHARSLRKGGKFVQVNCAAIPEELIESELFGHEKGSFTGAIDRKVGKFAIAHQGTLFLDEIGDLSLRAQAKVLRVLEEGEIQPVGSDEIRRVNVRVIAATNKDLAAEIGRGSFRQDLYFRLNVVPLHSPALREHRQDIPDLVAHFIDYFRLENNYRKRSFAEDALDALRAGEWRGNVRELRNLVERMLIMAGRDVITLDDLPAEFHAVASDATTDHSLARTWKDFRTRSERDFLLEKLKEYRFNIARTAREIDLPRSNLYKKIENLGIILPENREADDESPSA